MTGLNLSIKNFPNSTLVMIPSKAIIKQRDITDCGAACLASIAAYYQLQVPIALIRQKAGTDKQGTNVLGMIEAAAFFGLEARGVKGPFEALDSVPLPIVVHVLVKQSLHHYCVVYKMDKKTVTLMDPGPGKLIKKTHADFQKMWTGVVILFSPSDHFQKGNNKVSHGQRFWQLIAPEKSLVLMALLAAICYTVLGLSTSIYLQKLIDFVLVEGNIRVLHLLSMAMIVILIFQMSFGFLKSWFSILAGQHIDKRLILGYYKHLFRLPQTFFDTMRVGEIISRINDAVKIRAFINEIAQSLIVNILIIGFSMAVMFMYYWKLALIILLIIPFYLVIYQLSNWVNKIWGRRLMEQSADLESQLVESLHNAGTIKRFGIESSTREKTETKFNTLLSSVFKSGTYSLGLHSSIEGLTHLFTIVILWAGSYFVIQRELTPGELLSFYALIAYFTGPASALIGANKSVQDALIAADRLFEIIDLDTEQPNEPKIELSPELIGDIQFSNVSFRYGTRIEVFRDLDLMIKKGSTTGIVGESGCGKSTLLSLLQNLYPLKQGRISIGQFDLKHISNISLRQLVSVVPQEINLFSGTLIENIALGEFNPDLKKIIELCSRLGIHDFIDSLPQGYMTTLNEQAVNLSGGQKQRLGLARALYKNPEILILDEATSALDPRAEANVHETLDWFKAQGKTIIIIAHRLKAIRYCDNIIVLHNGKVIEQGQHGDLIKGNGLYHQMLMAN